MRKRLSFMNNERGFFLPYVLFINTILFMVLTTNLAIHQNDVQITYRNLDHLKVETLIQMGRAKLLEELLESQSDNGEVQYSFSDGVVNITYSAIHKTTYFLQLKVNTERNSEYTINNRLFVPIST